jgi:molybdate transport system substrate-binding protein
MKKIVLVVLVLLAAAAAVWLLFPRAPRKPHLRLYAGAGLRPAVEKLVAAFEQEAGVRVEPDFGGSGLVLSRAREDATADLFLPGDAWYVNQLEKLSPGKVAGRAAVAYFVPTIIVYKGNPKGVKGLADLGSPDLRVGLGKADACQIGRVSARLLSGAGLDLAKLKPQESLTVNELGVWVKMKNVDAAIVWEAIAANLGPDVQTVAIPPAQNVVSEVVLARLAGSKRPEEAGKFLEFVKGPRGQEILRGAGYRVDRPPAPADEPDGKSGATAEVH